MGKNKDTGSVLHPTLIDEVCILVRGTANGRRLPRERHHLLVCLEHPASLCDSIQCPKAKKINFKETRQATACGLGTSTAVVDWWLEEVGCLLEPKG
jgi:hypothetical protein